MYIYLELDIWNQMFIVDINLQYPKPIKDWFKRYTRAVIAIGGMIDVGVMTNE